MIDEAEAKARYIRITITDTQKNGHFPAIWNVKVYRATKKADPKSLLPEGAADEEALLAGYPWIHKKDIAPEEHDKTAAVGHKIVDINAADYARAESKKLKTIANRTGGSFSGDQNVVVEVKQGKYGFYFNGKQTMRSDFPMPKTVTYNAPYTIVAWTLNPAVDAIETVAEFSTARSDFSTLEFRQGSNPTEGLISHIGWFENAGAPEAIKGGEGKWQHWVITFDGYTERVYQNGRLILERNMFLTLRPARHITLGGSMDGGNKFSGYIHSLQFYDIPFDEAAVKAAYEAPSDTEDKAAFEGTPAIRTRLISPTLVEVAVVDDKGEPLESGLLSYQYGAASGKPAATPALSERSNNSSLLLSTDGKATQTIYARLTDDSGAFDRLLTAEVSIPEGLFTHFADDASAASPQGWDGINLPQGATCEVVDGTFRLSSAGTNLTVNKAENGVILYKVVQGDFIAQAKVTGMAGEEERKSPAYNEGGLLVIDDAGEHEQTILQAGVFPSYNCGNMLTLVSRRGRPQFPAANGWHYNPYLQVERRGNLFHVRTSADGNTWTEMTGSPIELRQLEGKPLKVGLYHTTYSPNEGWAAFDDFHLWQKREK